VIFLNNQTDYYCYYDFTYELVWCYTCQNTYYDDTDGSDEQPHYYDSYGVCGNSDGNGACGYQCKHSGGYSNGKCSICNVTATLSITDPNMSLYVYESSRCSYNKTPSNAPNNLFSWSSSNTSVATVSSDGTVTAKSEGTATITVKNSAGVTLGTVAVTVGNRYALYLDPVTGSNHDFTFEWGDDILGLLFPVKAKIYYQVLAETAYNFVTPSNSSPKTDILAQMVGVGVTSWFSNASYSVNISHFRFVNTTNEFPLWGSGSLMFYIPLESNSVSGYLTVHYFAAVDIGTFSLHPQNIRLESQVTISCSQDIYNRSASHYIAYTLY